MPPDLRTALAPALVLLALSTLHAGSVKSAEPLRDIRARLSLTVDPSGISVSGLSSGGWMANQFHIAFSAKVMGAGILAAGPYRCAGGSSWLCSWTPYGWLSPHDSCQAVHVCTRFARKNFGPLAYYLGPPDPTDSYSATLAEAAAGRIDPIEGLNGDRVWLFSGVRDSLAPPETVIALKGYYERLFARDDVGNPEGNIVVVRDIEMEHAMPVDIPGPPDLNRCGAYESPYINDCDYPAAGRLLAFIYDRPAPDPSPRYGTWDRGAMRAFDQRPFFDTEDESVSLNDSGNLYIPAACNGGVGCPLHVAFHGCEQHRDAIDAAHGPLPAAERPYFQTSAGYNEYAEAFGIVVLYPQTKAWGAAGDAGKNPKGCWDWWGYSGPDYFRRTGKQMRAVEWMVDCLTGNRSCPE